MTAAQGSGDDTVAVGPASADTWEDVATVFGANGGSEGCWCAYWRVRTGPEYARVQGAPARAELVRLVTEGHRPGLLAYREGRPVGWCAVAPRAEYIRLRGSRTLRPDDPDDPGVWALPCFYVRAPDRRHGVADALVDGAVTLARRHGARTVECYPHDTRHRRYGSGELYTGTVDLFGRHEFTEVARPSPGRVIMRRDLTTSTTTLDEDRT